MNANISTGGGALTLIASDRASAGVVSAQRDAGAGNLTMAPGVTLAAGAGNITLRLLDGAGVANAQAGSMALGGITTSGMLTLDSAGMVTQSAAISAANLALAGTGGVSLTNTSNAFGAISGSASTLSLVDTGALTVNALAVTGAARISTTGALTLAGAVSSQAGSDALVLSGSRFVNAAGSLATPNGRWLVFAPAISDITPGALSAGRYYNLAYASYTGSNVNGAGNRFVSAEAPILTVTANNQSITYGDTLGQGVTITGRINGDTVAQAHSGAALVTASSVNFGTQTLTPSLGALTSDNNYGFSFTNGSLNVAKKSLTVNGLSATSRAYDGTTNAAITGMGTLVGVLSGDSVALGGAAAGSFATANADNGIGVTVTGLSLTNDTAGNYALTQPTGLTGNITPAPLFITADNASRLYGSASPAFTARFEGFVGGETVAVLSGTPGFSSNATSASGVGSYLLTPSGYNALNYLIGYRSGTLSILPAPLELRANDASWTRNLPQPSFTFSLSGLRLNDTASVISGLSINTPANSSSPAGLYPIIPSSATAANYALSFVDGVLTLTVPATTPMAEPSTPPPLIISTSNTGLSTTNSLQTLTPNRDSSLPLPNQRDFVSLNPGPTPRVDLDGEPLGELIGFGSSFPTADNTADPTVTP